MATITPDVLPGCDMVTGGEWKFEETSYEPPAKVTAREVALLSDNDLLTGFKKQHKRTQAELDAFVIFYDEIVARFKEAQPRGVNGQFQSSGRPTLKEALDVLGLNYDTARKRKQRYIAALNTQLRLLKPLDDGEVAQTADSGEVVVVGNSQPGKMEVVPLGGKLEEAKTVPANSLTPIRAKRVAENDLILDSKTNKLYKYIGKGLLKNVDTSTVRKQKDERDNAEFEAAEQRRSVAAKAKAEANSRMKEENAQRDRDLVAEKPAKDTKPKAVRAQKPEKAKTKAQLEADKKTAEEKAKQAAKDRVMRAEIKAETNAFFAQHGYDESNRYIGRQEVDEGE